MTTDLFLVSYPNDYPWIPFLFRSIDKHVTNFRNVVLVIEEQDPPPPDLPAYVVLKRCRNYRGTEVPGYYGQSIEGIRAHTHTDADVIWFLESDCVFTRPIDIGADRDFPVDKPILLHTPWDRVGSAQCWRPTVEVLLGAAPAETMRRHPFVYPRELFASAWAACGGEEKLRKSGHLSQFNVLGNHALMTCPEKFTVIETGLGDLDLPNNPGGNTAIVRELAPPCMRQFWSHHTPEHPDVVAELKAMGLL